ncbi:MAG: nucleotidyl transferase AbiEii/AbiGii toxin family protein, partial [Gammaproteobacteria bacterium]|nr:nucleotidyl transferase AbiEii/AbiGii toxin family protein [Gammaproteobacteria bacterium]
RQALIIYLISHPRPIAELLNPVRKDLKQLYEGEFVQMEQDYVSLEELELTRGQLIRVVNESLTENEKRFLLSFKNKMPDWSLLNLQSVETLPAVNWKLINLKKMEPEKHKAAYEKLQQILSKKRA